MMSHFRNKILSFVPRSSELVRIVVMAHLDLPPVVVKDDGSFPVFFLTSCGALSWKLR